METFRRDIQVNNEPRTFEFERMKNMIGVKFFIRTTDDKKKPVAFSLKQTDEGKWKLFPGALRWLYAIETELSNAINLQIQAGK